MTPDTRTKHPASETATVGTYVIVLAALFFLTVIVPALAELAAAAVNGLAR